MHAHTKITAIRRYEAKYHISGCIGESLSYIFDDIFKYYVGVILIWSNKNDRYVHGVYASMS